MSTFHTTVGNISNIFNILIKFLVRAIKQEKKIKERRIGKEED
jgi:hypothetical protein